MKEKHCLIENNRKIELPVYVISWCVNFLGFNSDNERTNTNGK